MKLALLFLLVFPAVGKETLRIYAYDSFLGKGSLGALTKNVFETKFGHEVKYVSFSSAGEALNQVEIEGKKTAADIVVGLDQNLVDRAQALQVFDGSWDRDFVATLSAFEPSYPFFIPFDYGHLAFVYDPARTKKIPATLEQFSQDIAFKKKVVVQDPRTSSIGLSLLAWTKALFGDKDYEKFWKSFSGQVITFTPGWSGAYNMFLQGAADFTLSYTTSPAVGKSKAVIFEHGHIMQIEGVAVLKSSPRKDLAQKWVKLLLSEEIQKELPTLQWMYPARKGTPLPPSFLALPPEPKTVSRPADWGKKRKQWLKEWQELVSH